MSDVLPLVVVGLATGSVHALSGIGLVLTYKTSGIFNFAYGAQAAAAAYLMFELWERREVPWPIAALLAIAVVGVLGGLLLEPLANALSKASSAARVVATVGLLLALQGLLTLAYGPSILTFDQFLPDRPIAVLGVNVRISQFVVALLAVAAVFGLYAFLRRARLGVAMQAVVDEPTLLALRGTSPVATRRWAWVIGSCFAAAAGLLLAPAVGLHPVLLTLLVVQAFGAAAVGAFESVIGTYLGGLGIGVAAALATGYATRYPVLGQVPTALPFVVLVVALLVMPKRRLLERGTRIVRGELLPRTFDRRTITAAVTAGGFLLVLLPAVAGTRLPIFTVGLGFVIIFSSLGLLVRTSGQVSLCHMAFAAVGAATFGNAVGAGLPWLIALVLGGVAAIPLGMVVALPAIRLSGVYLAVATFGFAILVERSLYGTRLLFGADWAGMSMPRPAFGPFATDNGYYYAVLGITALCCVFVVGVEHSRLGRLLRALSDSPAVLVAYGVNASVTRVLIFCVSAFLAGLAGALMGPVTGTASASEFGPILSLILVAVLFIAGVLTGGRHQPVVTPFLAAGVYAVLPGLFGTGALADVMADVGSLVFGLAAIQAATRVAGRRRRLRPSKRSLEREGRSPVVARAAEMAEAR